MKISNDGEGVVVSITDYGTGIPGNEIEEIFKPFNRAANSIFMEGFGLGLSIVTKILEFTLLKLRLPVS